MALSCYVTLKRLQRMGKLDILDAHFGYPDGCAATLMDRFVTCGGGDAHGATSTLNSAQLTDLVTYLDSL